MTQREDVVVNVRMTGVQQYAADARTAAGATDRLKQSARSTSTSNLERQIAPGYLPPGQTHAQWAAQMERDLAAMRVQAAALPGGSAAVAAEKAAIAQAKAANRPHPAAFGLRGRAIAQAAGAGRYAGLAMPFGGWGALLGVGAGFTAFNQIKAGVQNIGLNQQLDAQTQAGIKSTGGAAHVTAKHIDELSVSLGKLAGQQGETVKDSENILLTFANIRNEAGKGNKIFDQTSLAVANVASRMHTDMPQAALQLGKALNDPIKGVGALRRIGVQFTNQQLDQIKVMVASGNRMGAQRIILRELTREFGGSAKAAGKTLPGALVHLQESWEDARNKLVRRMIPALTTFTNWLAVKLPHAADAAGTALDILFNSGKGTPSLQKWEKRAGIPGQLVHWALGNHPGGMDAIRRDLYGTVKTGLTGQGQVDSIFGSDRSTFDKVLSLAQNPEPRSGGLHGMGNSTPFSAPPVKIDWKPDPGQAIYVMLDSQVLAKANTRANQKRTHAEGTGTSRKP